MICVLAVMAAIFVLFFVLPALIFALCASRHRQPKDFDQDPHATMDGTPYEPWKDVIVDKMSRLRQVPYQPVTLQAGDGTQLYGRWYPQGGKTALLIHGYRTTAFNNFFAIAEAFLEAGWSVLLPDARGSGKSGGRAALGLKEGDDALLWADWAAGQPGCTDIVVYGMSMGAAAVIFASNGAWADQVRVLVADGGYHDTQRQMYALEQFRFVPKPIFLPLVKLFFRWLLHVRVDANALDALRAATRPMCFVAGTQDATVSPETVEESYRACGTEKIFLKVDGAPHTLAFLVGGAEFQTALFEFIQKYTHERKEET